MDDVKLYKYATYVLTFIVALSVVLNVTTLMILDDVVDLQQAHINITVDDSRRINNLESEVYRGYHDEYVTIDTIDAIDGATIKIENGVAVYGVENINPEERFAIENYLINSEPLNDSGIEVTITNK